MTVASLRKAFVLGTLAAVLSCFVVDAARAQTTVPPRNVFEPGRYTKEAMIVGNVAEATIGCQTLGTSPPVLSNGTKASGRMDFYYDNKTHILTLVVQNDSEVTIGVANPVITQVAFNLPLGAVSGVRLISQTALAGAPPGFRLQVDPSAQPQLGMSCLGTFGVRLRTTSTGGAIGNPAAGTFAVPSPSLAFGAKFELELIGPGVAFLTAYTLAVGFSQAAVQEAVNVACRFEAGGAGGLGSGYISGVQEPAGPGSTGTRPSLWMNRQPAWHASATTTVPFDICIGAEPGRQGTLLASLNPIPSSFAGYPIPIGAPITMLAAVPVVPPAGQVCFTVRLGPPRPDPIPPVYLTFITFNPNATGRNPPSVVEAAPRFDVKIIPLN